MYYLLYVGVCREHGKAYAVYLISVTCTAFDGTQHSWDIYRRYSDFHDLHMIIVDKVTFYAVCDIIDDKTRIYSIIMFTVLLAGN